MIAVLKALNRTIGSHLSRSESVNPYNPSTSESTLTSQYVSLSAEPTAYHGLTFRFSAYAIEAPQELLHIGRTEMEGQQTHGKRASGKKTKK